MALEMSKELLNELENEKIRIGANFGTRRLRGVRINTSLTAVRNTNCLRRWAISLTVCPQ